MINLPFGVYVLRRAVREKWIPSRTVWQLIAIALVLHIAALGSLLAGISEAKMPRWENACAHDRPVSTGFRKTKTFSGWIDIKPEVM